MAEDMRCRLLFLWFGGSQVITQLTSTSVWCQLFLEASRRKLFGRECIRIYDLLSVHFRKPIEFPFPNLRKVLLSFQTTRTKASRSRVLLSRRSLLNHTSATAGLLRHSHTFSHRTNWTILFAIWSCPRTKQSYWESRLKQWNLLEKKVRISSFRSRNQQLVPSAERMLTLCSATM